jgi:hypothetical protein
MKRAFILLILFSCWLPANTQAVKNTLKNNEISITNSPDGLLNDSVHFIEKVYLQTDRTTYYPGDDLWFKAYLINASESHSQDLSKNLHVELISPSNKLVSSGIILLDKGFGNGDFSLSEKLESGTYQLRAYTNYMRNFGEQLFFSKDLMIINPSKDASGNSDKVEDSENKISVDFFPEGGSLLDSTSSIVAFKAVNSFGKGCDVHGKIFSSQGDLITDFSSTHLGMGSFFLRPAPGLKYYAVIKGTDGIDERFDLPASISTGVNLCVSSYLNKLLITTKTNARTLELVADEELILTISARNEVLKTVHYGINELVNHFVLPAEDLPDGIIMLSLTIPGKLSLSERLFYIEHKSPLKLQVKTDKLVYGRREPVALHVSLAGDTTGTGSANISLSAGDKKLTEYNSQFPRSISTWFLLESDVRGLIEDPAYYFDPSNPDRLKDLNLLLLTQGWRDFSWKYDLGYFPPEYGFTISGSLKRNNSGKILENSRVSIAVVEKGRNFFKSVPVDAAGSFRLSDLNFSGDSRIIVSGIGNKEDFQGLLKIDSAVYVPPMIQNETKPVRLMVEDRISELRSWQILNTTIKRKYKLSDTINLGGVAIISERHKDPQTIRVERSRLNYGDPDTQILITEQMTSYPSLADVLRGRDPAITVKGSFPNYSILIRTISTLTGSTTPLVLVDGKETDFDELIYTPVNFVDRIDILKSGGTTAIYGLRGSNGVINIITKSGAVGFSEKPVKYSANIRRSGYSISRVFYSPQHTTDLNQPGVPDLRYTLYWNPDIRVGSEKGTDLNFYNGDNSSIVKIRAEGLTPTGIPVTGEAEYEIR